MYFPSFCILVSCISTQYFFASHKYHYVRFLPTFPLGNSNYSWRILAVLFYHLFKYLRIQTLNSLELCLLLIRFVPFKVLLSLANALQVWETWQFGFICIISHLSDFSDVCVLSSDAQWQPRHFSEPATSSQNSVNPWDSSQCELPE